MFNFRKRLDVKNRIKRYNAVIEANPIPSVDEIPFWLCEDDVFHHIFDGRPDEDGNNCLFDLVNSALRNAKMNEIKNLVVKNPNVLKRRRRQKTLILDLRAEDEEGVVYDVEIQKRNRPGFWDRMFAYGDRLRAEQLDEGDDYTSLRPVVVIVFVAFPIRDDDSVWFDVYRETSQFDPTVVYDGKTTIFIRIPTRKDQTPTRVEDFGLKTWLKLFGYPKITTDDDVNLLEKIYPIVKNVRAKMRGFFGLWSGGEVRRVELALADGIGIGRTEGYGDGKRDGRAEGYGDGKRDGRAEGEVQAVRNMIIRSLRNRFPNANERFFSSCVEKLEKKNNEELNLAFDKSMSCSNTDEFAKTL